MCQLAFAIDFGAKFCSLTFLASISLERWITVWFSDKVRYFPLIFAAIYTMQVQDFRRKWCIHHPTADIMI
jgi:hypothetical protein